MALPAPKGSLRIGFGLGLGFGFGFGDGVGVGVGVWCGLEMGPWARAHGPAGAAGGGEITKNPL